MRCVTKRRSRLQMVEQMVAWESGRVTPGVSRRLGRSPAAAGVTSRLRSRNLNGEWRKVESIASLDELSAAEGSVSMEGSRGVAGPPACRAGGGDGAVADGDAGDLAAVGRTVLDGPEQ